MQQVQDSRQQMPFILIFYLLLPFNQIHPLKATPLLLDATLAKNIFILILSMQRCLHHQNMAKTAI